MDGSYGDSAGPWGLPDPEPMQGTPWVCPPCTSWSWGWNGLHLRCLGGGAPAQTELLQEHKGLGLQAPITMLLSPGGVLAFAMVCKEQSRGHTSNKGWCHHTAGLPTCRTYTWDAAGLAADYLPADPDQPDRGLGCDD